MIVPTNSRFLSYLSPNQIRKNSCNLELIIISTIGPATTVSIYEEEPPEVFCKKKCSQKFRKIQRKTLETLAQVFSFEFCKISKNNFFIEHFHKTASVYGLNRSHKLTCYCELHILIFKKEFWTNILFFKNSNHLILYVTYFVLLLLA